MGPMGKPQYGPGYDRSLYFLLLGCRVRSPLGKSAWRFRRPRVP